MVASRMSEGWTWCAVVNSGGVVLGRLRRRHLDERPDATAGEVMEPGPSTYRPSTPAREMLDIMTKGGFERAFVTDSNGRLLGLVARHDLAAALEAHQDLAPGRQGSY